MVGGLFQLERWPEPPLVVMVSTIGSVPWGLTRGNPVPGGFVPAGEGPDGKVDGYTVSAVA